MTNEELEDLFGPSKKVMTKEQMVEKLNNNPILRMLFEPFKGKYDIPYLTGGAVIDILDGRTPKDYDFLGTSQLNVFLSNGFKFICETHYAITLTNAKNVVQLLKTNKNDFDFTISASQYKPNQLLNMCEVSFNNKILIPINFTNRKNIINSLFRIPHWRKKGYGIHDTTYKSLIHNLSDNQLGVIKQS